MESPVATTYKINAGEMTSDLESNFDITSPVNKQKLEVKPENLEADKSTGNQKSKYRVGQVVNDQDTDDTRTQKKTQTKPPSEDPEPEKENTLKNRLKDPRTSLAGLETLGKEKPKLDESGMNTGRSDKGQKAKKFNQNTSQTSWPVEPTGQGTYEVYEKMMESKGVPQTAQEIEAENKLLRQFLKDLNEQLKHHVERAKIVNYEGKKTEFRDKNPEDQIKTIVRELANNEKILAYNKEEHRKSETRLNSIKDPGYVFNIQKEIISIQASIDAMKKENKKLGLITGNVGKDLDVIENVKGIPGNLEETHEKEKELLKFSQRLEALKQKNTAALEEKKRKEEKEQTLSEKIKKFEKAYFGDSYISEDTRKKMEKMTKHAAAAEEDLRIAQNRCKFKATQAMRDLEELYVLNNKESEHVERLDDVLRDQALALKELISTEGSRLNKGAQEVLEQIKSSLENEERQKKMAHLEEVKSGRDRDRGVALLKNKSIDRMGNIQPVNPHLNYSTSTKHKNAIRRELEEKKPAWKEVNAGERARMEEHLSPLKMKKIEDTSPLSKPNKLLKAPKQESQEDITEDKKVEKNKPEEKKPKVIEEKKTKEIAPKISEQVKLQYNISPKASQLHEKEETKKEEKIEIKKEKEAKKKIDDLNTSNDDLGQLKEEIAEISGKIEKEVEHGDKVKASNKKKKSKIEGELGNMKLGSDNHKEEETEKVFDLGAKKKEKDQTNLKLDASQPPKSNHTDKNEELPIKSKRESESKKKENEETNTKKTNKPASPQKDKDDDVFDFEEMEDSHDNSKKKTKPKNDADEISKQKPSQFGRPIKIGNDNKDGELPAKSKREEESKKRDNDNPDTKRTKKPATPQKDKDDDIFDFEEMEDSHDNNKKKKPNNDAEEIPKQKPSQFGRPIKIGNDNKDEELPAKSKREEESKRKESEDIKKAKNHESAQKKKESSQVDKEEVREWDDNEHFDDNYKKKPKTEVKAAPKKEKKVEEADPDFEELNFDD